jgi:hypothetical protein
MPSSIFVLVHSPLVGPYAWSLTAEQLRLRGCRVIVPVLESQPSGLVPYWQSHVQQVCASLDDIFPTAPLILVGHSGAGPLLPAIGQGIEQPVAAYLFVDAVLPEDGKSRLDLFEDARAASQFRLKARNGLLPVWSADDLRTLIPQEQIRLRFVSELSPLPLAVYEEVLPVFAGWPDAPCAYLQFGSNPAYASSVQRARQAGFVIARLEAGHFHMLVDPGAVTQALLDLTAQLGL